MNIIKSITGIGYLLFRSILATHRDRLHGRLFFSLRLIASSLFS